MTNNQKVKQFDLEDRTFNFAKLCAFFIRKLPRSITNIEYSKQLARSSGSVAANYIEANESLSKKDFCLHIKICRKEAKESQLWLKLIDVNHLNELLKIQAESINEAGELKKIFSTIVTKRS